MRRFVFIVLGVLGVVVTLLVTGFIVVMLTSDARPTGAYGPEADALARTMLEHVDAEAWSRTGVVAWTFRGGREHLWDRERNFERFRVGNRETLLDVSNRTGTAFEDGKELEGEARAKAVEAAYAAWANDSFWLNPVVKCFDAGTTRSIVNDENGTHLMVAYAEGGVTPGDAYMWDVGDAQPTAWRMWVKVLPIGGLKVSWEDWVKLPTGAWIATKHRLGPLTVEIKDVKAATSLGELVPGTDPFERIAQSTRTE